jgi:hypothetical protein
VRALASAVVALTALVAVAAAGGAMPAAPCRTAQLDLVYKGFDGAAGTGYELFRLVPNAGVRCSMSGYPGVTLLGPKRRKLDIAVGRYHDELHSPATLVFTHARPARFDIRHPDMTRSGHVCSHRVTAVRVIPPGETHALTAPVKTHVCTHGARVSPVGSRY